jgi:Co/Zn/Cd efflux system component
LLKSDRIIKKINASFRIERRYNSDTHFEAKIEVEDMALSKTIGIQKQIEHKLHDKYEINHATLQYECGACAEIDLIKKELIWN